MTNYYTSDTHFGHPRAIIFNNRPYHSIEEMNESFILNWNAVVGDDDDVYHLGDFANKTQDKDARAIFNRLNGRKHLIIGNHDKENTLTFGWASEPALRREIYDDGQMIVLDHYPIWSWNQKFNGSLHLFGHMHKPGPVGCNQSLEVGVDCWNYFPVTLEQINERLATLPPFPPEHHYMTGDQKILQEV